MFCDIADLLHVKLTKPFWNPTCNKMHENRVPANEILWILTILTFCVPVYIVLGAVPLSGCVGCWPLLCICFFLFIKQVYFFKPKYSMLLIPLKAGDTSSPIRICNHIQHNIQVNKIAMILWFQVSFLSISLCMYNDFVIVPWQVLIYTLVICTFHL